MIDEARALARWMANEPMDLLTLALIYWMWILSL